jgi:hypothetical protein
MLQYAVMAYAVAYSILLLTQQMLSIRLSSITSYAGPLFSGLSCAISWLAEDVHTYMHRTANAQVASVRGTITVQR